VTRNSVEIIRRASFVVKAGEAVGLCGTAGSGKTTLLLALAGIIPSTGGEVLMDGQCVTSWPVHKRARAGIRLGAPSVTLVAGLTVKEHLRLASLFAPGSREMSLAGLFRERLNSRAGQLSGGMQRVLTTWIALQAQPRVLLVDDIAEGLQPSIIEAVLSGLREAKRLGAALVLVDRSMGVLEQVCDFLVRVDDGQTDVPVLATTKK
jgi:ABC-type branched-subunit amino acid transport system ATPase component